MRLARRFARVLPFVVGLLGLGGAARAEDPPVPAAPAEPRIEKPLLWKAEGKATVYLFGTIHLPEAVVGTLPESVTEALESSDVVFGELSAKDMDDTMTIMRRAMAAPDQGLSKVLGEELHKRLGDYLATKNLPVAAFERMKPWVVAVNLQVLDYLQDLQKGGAIDKVLATRATKAGKEALGLETITEQLDLFDQLTSDEQVRFLSVTLDEIEKAAKEGKKPGEELLAAYRSGDLAKLLAVLQAQKPEDDLGRKVMKLLLEDRNGKMADRIAEHAAQREGKTLFVYVGAAHLPGENGVLALLEKKGWKPARVEEVVAAR